MKITRKDTDYIVVDELNYCSEKLMSIDKIHIIKIMFSEPTEEKIRTLLDNFKNTQRYVICDNIKLYNSYLKRSSKKYYIENNAGQNLITFLRKNNKVLLNFNNLNHVDRKYSLFESVLRNILKNVEIVQMSRNDFEENKDCFVYWSGNLIISN